MNTDFSHLDDLGRKAILLAQVYEETRKNSGQAGYNAKIYDEGFETTTLFKTCKTIVAWLEQRGWHISLKEVHWQGYVRYVFDSFKPNPPQPGQLRNDVLLKAYLKSIPKQEEKNSKALSDKQLSEVYDRVLRPEVSCLQTYLTMSPTRSVAEKS